MPQPIQSSEEVSILVKILTFLGAVFSGAISASWLASKKLSGIEARQSRHEEKIQVINDIVFLEKGGLNVVTVEMHEKLCGINGERHANDMEIMKLSLSHIMTTVDEIKSNIKSNGGGV